MRIITGSARGKKLLSLDGEETTRPTLDRVKEGLFSAIQFELEDRRVLDLFAGSGQLGLEALSRGAAFCVFIDQSKDATDIIKTNAKNTDLYKNCRVSCMDYSEFLKSASGKEKFDLVFLDPPYAKDMQGEILKKVSRADILNDGALIVCETDKDDMSGDVYGLKFRKKYRYGKIFVTLFEKFSEEKENE